jgi:DNA-binding NtrC family response regulator
MIVYQNSLISNKEDIMREVVDQTIASETLLPTRSEDLGLMGESAAIQEVREQIRTLARFKSIVVLFQGETGTGKEQAAKALHYATFHPKQNTAGFIIADFSRLHEDVIERELFGSLKGAFTDALGMPGLIEAAGTGTLFLDEVGNTNDYIQQRLLRFLGERTFSRLGSTKEEISKARVILASQVNLEEAVRNRAFREDLYFRLVEFKIEMPPLRSRKNDIPLLAQHFLKAFELENKEVITQGFQIDAGAMKWLKEQQWPGNVRQLQQTVRGATLICIINNRIVVSADDFARVTSHITIHPTASTDGLVLGADVSLTEIRKRHVELVLERHLNTSRACKILGIARNTLYGWRKEPKF